jgi:hypothetical protein
MNSKSGNVFLKLGRKKIYICFTAPMAGFGKYRLPKFVFEVPMFKFVSCFKFRAETLQNSLGYTVHPIELKLGVLPI